MLRAGGSECRTWQSNPAPQIRNNSRLKTSALFGAAGLVCQQCTGFVSAHSRHNTTQHQCDCLPINRHCLTNFILMIRLFNFVFGTPWTRFVHSEHNKTPVYLLSHLFYFALSRQLCYTLPSLDSSATLCPL